MYYYTVRRVKNSTIYSSIIIKRRQSSHKTFACENAKIRLILDLEGFYIRHDLLACEFVYLTLTSSEVCGSLRFNLTYRDSQVENWKPVIYVKYHITELTFKSLPDKKVCEGIINLEKYMFADYIIHLKQMMKCCCF